jgi:hypothetical protein
VACLLLGQRAVARAGGLGGQLVALERGGLGQLVALGGGLGDQPLALGGGVGQQAHALGLGLGQHPIALGADGDRHRLGLDAGHRGDLLAGDPLVLGAQRLERRHRAIALSDRRLELVAHPIALGGGLAEPLLGVLGVLGQLLDAILQLRQLELGAGQPVLGGLVVGGRPRRGPGNDQIVLELADLLLEALGPAHRLVALEQHRGQLVRGRPRLGVHLADQLADPLGQRAALVLDRRPRLALHRQPVRQLGVDAAGRRQRALRPEHLDQQAADQRDLTGGQRRDADAIAADEHPVGAAQILDPDRVAVERHPRVLARHARIVAADRAVRGPADDRWLRAELVRAVDAIDVAIEQGGHARTRG